MGIDQATVKITGLNNRFFNRGLGDFVEHHALDDNAWSWAQDFQQMPRDGFTFAVFVGCEIQGVNFFQLRLQVFDDIFFVFRNDIQGRKPVIDIHAKA